MMISGLSKKVLWDLAVNTLRVHYIPCDLERLLAHCFKLRLGIRDVSPRKDEGRSDLFLGRLKNVLVRKIRGNFDP